VTDDYATHKTKPIRIGLAKRPRWKVHFTPAGASWINQVVRLLALLTDERIRLVVHCSTQALANNIRAVVEAHYATPKPFRIPKPPITSSPASSASASEHGNSEK
jgi:hypothetical protein